MSSAKTTATVRMAELEAALARLPRNVVDALEKRALRAALKPVRDKLRTAWTSTPGRKGTHRRAIAESTKIDARRRGNDVVARIGVDYRFKVGRRAHQRIWHLLEAGFRHLGSSKVYAGKGVASATAKAARSAFIRSQVTIAEANWPKGRGSQAERRKALNRVRAAASVVMTERARLEAHTFGSMRKAALVSAKRIAGRRLSQRIAEAEFAPATERAAVLMLQEARKELAK